MAVSSEYQRRLQTLRSGGPSLTIEQAQAMKAQAEAEAMTPEQRRAQMRKQNEPLPVYELGKNILTGEMVYTNQPATSMLEQDQRLSKFVKSNEAQAARLAGKTKPYKGIGTEDYGMAQLADEFIFTGQEPQPEAPASSEAPASPGPSAPIPNLLSDMRYFVSPQFRTPTAPQASEEMLVPESTEPPPPLAKSLSPEAQAVVAIGEAAKAAAPGAGRAILKAAEVLPVVGGPITRARMIAAAPEVGEFVAGPGTRAVREIQTRGQEFAPKAATQLAPLAVRAGLAGARLVPQAGAKVGSVTREVTQYADLNRQAQERAKRRAALGELYPLALADEQRKAAKIIAQGAKK